ncbi:MAG: FAD-dependent oxidoreductase [Thermoleophilaceae bacterium]
MAPPARTVRADVAVVGAGAAGLYAALWAARRGARVALVSRSPLRRAPATGRREESRRRSTPPTHPTAT